MTRTAVNSTEAQILGPVSFYSLGTKICGKETPKRKHEHEQRNDTRVVCQVDGILHSGPGHALVSQINICSAPKCP